MSLDRQPVPPDLLAALHGNATVAANKFLAPDGIDPADADTAIRHLDRYIGNVRETQDAQARRRLGVVIGAFLGEAIIARHGGEWAVWNGAPVVAFGRRDAVNPIAKATEQLENGDEDSIYSFFASIPVIYAGRLQGR